MRILLMPIGSAGDVYPYIRLGVELQRRGHKIIMATSDVFRDLAVTEGFAFISLANREEHEQVQADPLLWNPRRGANVFVRNVILRFMQRQYKAIEECWRNNQCDAVVAAGQAIGARIAQEKLGVPLATVHLSPFFFRSSYRNRRVPGLVIPDFVPRNWKQALFRAADFAGDWIYGGAVNEFRGSLGLKPANAIFWDWWNSPQLILALFPRWFAPPQPDWPPQTQLTGFPLYDPPHVESLSPKLAAFLAAGERPIVFTPGTAMAHANEFFATSLRAVEVLNRRAIFVSQFLDQLPKTLPDSVAACRYAPFGELLPRASAIVHHGGIGSISQALAAGIPQLVMPRGFDQPENASRIVDLKIGAQISPRRYSIGRVAQELRWLLSSQDILSRCQDIALRFPAAAQVDEACCAIEGLAGSNICSSTTASHELAATEHD